MFDLLATCLMKEMSTFRLGVLLCQRNRTSELVSLTEPLIFFNIVNDRLIILLDLVGSFLKVIVVYED